MPNITHMSRTAKGAVNNLNRRNSSLRKTIEDGVDTGNNIRGAMGNAAGYAAATDTFSSRANLIASIGNFGGMGAMMVPGLLSGAAIYGTKGMGYAVKGAGSVVGAEHAGSGLLGAADKLKTGYENIYTKRLIGETKFGNTYANVVDTVTKPIFTFAGAIDSTFGILTGRANSLTSKAGRFGQRAAEHAAELHPHLTPDLQSHLNDLLHAAHHHDGELYDASLKAIKDAKEVSGMPKAFHKTFGRVEKFTEKQMKTYGKAQDWAELASGNYNTAEKLKSTTVQHGTMNSLFALGATAETALMIRDTHADIKTMREMLADIKGVNKDQITSGDMLFSDLPYAGQQARRALFTSAAPRTILEAVGQYFNVKFILGKDASMLLMLIPGLISAGVGQLTSGNILDTYKEMKKNEEQGIPNDVEHYTKLIGLANKQLHNHLGPESSFAKEVGRIYAEKQVSLKQTLADAQDGIVDQLLADIRKHNTVEAQQEKLAVETSTPSATLSEVDSIDPNGKLHKSVSEHVNGNQLNETLETASFADRVSKASGIGPEASRV